MAYAKNLMLWIPGYIFYIAFCTRHDICAFGLRIHVLCTQDYNTGLVPTCSPDQQQRLW